MVENEAFKDHNRCRPVGTQRFTFETELHCSKHRRPTEIIGPTCNRVSKCITPTEITALHSIFWSAYINSCVIIRKVHEPWNALVPASQNVYAKSSCAG